MKRTLIAGMLVGVVAFVWSSIAHMMSFTGHLGLSTMNEKAEDAIDQVIGWLLAGFLMAKMIKPAQAQAANQPALHE